jgi:hypothetical protein
MPSKCLFSGYNKRPVFNIKGEKTGLYCNEHKKENMVNVKDKRCVFEGCNKQPTFNLPTEKTGLYCFQHKDINMINIHNKTCQLCKNPAIYGLPNKRAQFCFEHKKPNTINIILDSKCSVPDCENEYSFIIGNNKFCLTHAPETYEINIKRLCKYCDIKEKSNNICKDCMKVMNKKEWAIVRHIRKNIHTPFEYNSCKMLQGCSKKRPDVFFELSTYCLIVEIDEYQHKSYDNSCECARINEIVNGIGGKSVIIIRFNPDVTKHKKKSLKLTLSDKVDLLIDTIKNELVKEYNTFQVKIIQLYYDDNYDIYQEIKEENITDKVAF